MRCPLAHRAFAPLLLMLGCVSASTADSREGDSGIPYCGPPDMGAIDTAISPDVPLDLRGIVVAPNGIEAPLWVISDATNYADIHAQLWMGADDLEPGRTETLSMHVVATPPPSYLGSAYQIDDPAAWVEGESTLFGQHLPTTTVLIEGFVIESPDNRACLACGPDAAALCERWALWSDRDGVPPADGDWVGCSP